MILNTIALPRSIARQVQTRPSQRYFNRASEQHFSARHGEDETVIDLYDEIGFFGVSALDFRRRLNEVKTPRILLRVNSPGGDVFDGIAIHNDLAAHPAEVTVRVTGIAASAASVIAMAGDRIEIFENAFLMIHNAWGLSIGDRNDMQAFAEVLQQIDTALAETYAARSGKEASEIAGLMDAETWLGGAAAVEEGFADALADGDGENRAAASFDLSRFKNLPAALRGARADPRAPAEPIVIAAEERAALEGLIKAIVS